MAIPAGTRLGPYEVLSAIGAGGMGEVYRARDTRLDRTVAIKILPVHLADRPESRERFEREARTIASLNHPHICTLHDIGRQDGIDFLVMEYVEGETLAVRLLKGPLVVEQVLQYAIEITDALDKAHRKGITHRDLKPSNIMLTKSGAKLLDFGLAKLKQEVAPSLPASQLPTLKENPTVEGTILGTLQYMSPEQLEGKVSEIDSRTDIFSFGAVLYEMATGKKAFDGKSSVSLIGAILKDNPPPISSLQPMTPASFDRLVRKCLEKESEKRWQDAGDLCDELKWIVQQSGTHSIPVSAVAQATQPKAHRSWILPAALACALGAIVATLAIWFLKPALNQPVTRTVITLPPGQHFADSPDVGLPVLALSPDGARLAYVAVRDGNQEIYLRALDSAEAVVLPGTEGAWSPFFSPDGLWLGFYQNGFLKKISVNGGAATTLSGNLVSGRGADWSSQGVIVFSPNSISALQRVPESGGAPQPLTHLEQGEGNHRWPDWLPGGKAVLFDTANGDSGQIVVSTVAGERRNLGLAGTSPRYAASGHLLFAQNGALVAVPFDPDRLEVKGAAVPVLDSVRQYQTTTGAAHYSVSNTGTLVYLSGGTGGGQRKLVWVSRNGAEQLLAAPPRTYGYPRLSPDGRRIAVEDETQIWIYDIARETLSRLTFEGSQNQNPVWTPDGKRIAFYSTKGGTPTPIFWIQADGGGGLERLSTIDPKTQVGNEVPRSWSPDGKLLAFHAQGPGTQRDIWILNMSDHKSEPFLRTPFTEGAPVFSPDGHWIAYVSNESGHPEIYVQPYPAPGGKWQVSTEGGTEPVWNRSGRELFYREGKKMMSVDVTTQATFAAGKPKVLFEGDYFASQFPLTGVAYDVTADGQRFLMVKAIDPATAVTQINVVQNWFEELKRRVPTGTK